MVNDVQLVDEKTQEMVEVAINDTRYDVEITDPEVYEQAGARIKLLKGHMKTIEDQRKALVAPFLEGKRKLDAFFKSPYDACDKACKAISARMGAFRREQDRIAAEEQKKADEIAAKEAAKLEKKAEKAEAKGQDDKAEDLRQDAEQAKMAAPVVKPEVPKATSVRKVWKFEVTDSSKVDRKFMMPNEKMIGQMVRAMKDNFKEDGIRVYCEETDY